MVGDLFAVPLPDGTRKLGQVVAYEKGGFLRSVVCGFTLRDVPEGRDVLPSVEAGDFIAVQYVTPDGLTFGRWPVVGHVDIPDLTGLVGPRVLGARGHIGMRVVGDGLLDDFLGACMGLRPWDEMHDPHWYDALLLAPEMRPEGVIYAKGTVQ